MGKIFWIPLPFRAEDQRVSLIFNPQWKEAFEKDITDRFFSELKVMANSVQNQIIAYFGPQGFGKSYALIYTAERFAEFRGIPLSIENVGFSFSDMLLSVEHIVKGDILITDEQTPSTGAGSKVERLAINQIDLTVRKFKISHFYSSPQFIGLPFHKYFEIWHLGTDEIRSEEELKQVVDELNNGKLKLEDIWKYTRSLIFNHKSQVVGSVITGTPKNKIFLQQYENKKDDFLDRMLQIKGGSRYPLLEETATGLLNIEKFLTKWLIADSQKTDKVKLKDVILSEFLQGKLLSGDEQKRVRALIDSHLMQVKYGLEKNDTLSSAMENIQQDLKSRGIKIR